MCFDRQYNTSGRDFWTRAGTGRIQIVSIVQRDIIIAYCVRVLDKNTKLVGSDENAHVKVPRPK